MSTNEQLSKLRAVITQARAVEEKLSAAVAMPERPKDGAASRIKTETNTTFELGIPENGAKDTFQISIAYAVTLVFEKEDLKLCAYECKFLAIFSLVGTNPDWDNLPPAEITPYFSFVHHLVRQQAEGSLVNAGFRGVTLPVPDNLKPPNV